jgi:hypothetical protein
VCWPSGYHVADANCSDVASAAARPIADPSCGRRERRPIRASPAHVKENAVAVLNVIAVTDGDQPLEVF